MRFVLFCHSLLSDWNHGNAHFLRGVVRELQRRGHAVRVFEPADGWSRSNLIAEHGQAPLLAFRAVFPDLSPEIYDPATLDLDRALDGADVVIVHEWTAPELVARIGRHRAAGGGYRLLFHDTHHRALTAPDELGRFDFDAFDGVLAFGEVLCDLYRRLGWGRRAWTWHEAADTTLFRPPDGQRRESDLIWIGNWGDGERGAELDEFLLEPIRALGLQARIHGVRYPAEAREAVRRAGARFGGWLPNHAVPDAFARHRVTVHVPRRPYAAALPGIPTIRVFEALACGIPLISAPWHDVEELFRPGRDFLFARTGEEMKRLLRAVLADPDLAAGLAASGLDSIRRRHSCAHRVDQLLGICRDLGVAETAPDMTGASNNGFGEGRTDGQPWERDDRFGPQRRIEHCLLRIEPAVGLLERRGNVL